ncbi:MAG TPA: TonB-dependent receptor, partial [Polyangiaceae bacterium]|nr:TonB-dependent receptor [Polyangiaceae bacterium]
MPISLRAACVMLAVLLTWPLSAAAEDLSMLTPPVPEGSTDVPYPPGAEGDARVVLELIVAKDGSVSSATAVEGAEPFAEHARRAVLGWHFVPAQRGNVPIVARIRVQIFFDHPTSQQPATAPPPAPSASSAAEAPASAVPTVPPATPEPPVEITVSGVRREVGQLQLSAEEVREMPGAFGDAFRAVEALPGLTPLVSGIAYFYVRGAPPNNSGYYVDGVKIPLLFHLGLGQGVIHPGLIDHVDLFPSAAPARYGGSAGGIVVGQTREPARAPHGELNLRLVDAGALLETPFGDGRGSVLVAGRYGYPAAILRAVSPDIAIGYWDYQTRATWQLTKRDTLGLFAFGSHDYWASRSPSGDPAARAQLVEQFVSDFHRLDLRYDHATTGGNLRLALTGGYTSQGAAPTYVKDDSLGLRLEFDQRLSESVRLRAGTDTQFAKYYMRITATGPGEPTVPAGADPPPTNLSAAVHTDLVLRLSPRVELVPGLRAEVFVSSRENEAPVTGRSETVVPALSPRLSARTAITRGVAWLSNLGLSHQYPSLRVGNVPAPLLTVPGFPFGVQRLQTAAQASTGFELALPAQLVVTTTGFFTHFSGLTDLTAACFQDEPAFMAPISPPPGMVAAPYVCPNNQPVSGQAFGLELLLRAPLSNRLSGWLSYTLSRSTREAHFATRSGGQTLATVP